MIPHLALGVLLDDPEGFFEFDQLCGSRPRRSVKKVLDATCPTYLTDLASRGVPLVNGFMVKGPRLDSASIGTQWL